MEEKHLIPGIGYQPVFRALPTLCLIINADGPAFTIVDASDAWLSATMRRREEIVGRGMSAVFSDRSDDPASDVSSEIQNCLTTLVKTRQYSHLQQKKYRLRQPAGPDADGGERQCRLSFFPVFDAQGDVCTILHLMEDVTEKVSSEKKAGETRQSAEEEESFIFDHQGRITVILEAMLRYTTMDFSKRIPVSEYRDELDAIVVGLNSLIDELESYVDRLTGVNRELAYANKELDSFSYSVSHDLRAPLRAIMGYSQVLLEDYRPKLDDEGCQTIDIIIRNTLRMSTLIDDLLTFSRVGKQNLTKVQLDMNHIFRSAIRELTDHTNETRTEVHMNELLPVEGDGSMMKQVAANLISNAMKYSGKRKKTIIHISSFAKDDTVVYSVKDNGVGFDMKYYDKLFGVFQRLHSGSDFEGTGVGLALVQRIIRKHHGDVWAESAPDQGAVFSFSLPVNETIEINTTQEV